MKSKFKVIVIVLLVLVALVVGMVAAVMPVGVEVLVAESPRELQPVIKMAAMTRASARML